MKRELTEIEMLRVDGRGRAHGRTIAGDGTERPVIVAGAYPGDVVDVRLRRRKAGAYLGEVQEIRHAAVERRAPFCRHFTDCGGCTIQDISYDDQRALKRAMVRAAFSEAGFAAADWSESDLPAVLRAPAEVRYRNKLEFSFGAQRWLSEDEIAQADTIADRRGLGFHVAGRFDRVLDLKECHLQPEPSEEIRRWFREYAEREGLTFYDAREHVGLLRLLVIRTSLSGETMVTVMFGADDPPAVQRVMDAVAERFPAVASLNYVINTSKNDSLFPHDVVTWRGRGWITEVCGPNRLRLRPKAFYQTNPAQALRLYETAVSMTGLSPGLRVFDLYSGIGSIALFVARSVASVVGVESVGDAVISARENADLNGITNAVFEAGEVEAVLPDVAARHGTPDLVILDPPRSGVHPKARRALRELGAPRILYISCNPRTQATDIAELHDLYEVDSLQPVDMFPQTRHVENIAVLRRRVTKGEPSEA